MRLFILLCLALSGSGCGGERLEYDPCEPAEAGQVRCAMACPGGGTGCTELIEVAVQCVAHGERRWEAIGDCALCGEVDGANAVVCSETPPALSVLWASCVDGVEACSMDRRAVLRCVDGEYRVKDFCAETNACAQRGSSVDCI